MISGCCWDAGCGTAFNLPLPFVMLSCGTKRDQIARRLPVEVSFGVGSGSFSRSIPFTAGSRMGLTSWGSPHRANGSKVLCWHGMKGLAGQFLLFQ